MITAVRRPSEVQIDYALLHRNYRSLLKWVKAGVFDNDETLQRIFWRGVSRIVKELSPSSKDTPGVLAMHELLSATGTRPDHPWQSSYTAWKLFWTCSEAEGIGSDFVTNSGHNFIFSTIDPKAFFDIVGHFAKWTVPPEGLSAYQKLALLNVARYDFTQTFLPIAIPPSASSSDKTALFWDCLTTQVTDGKANLLWQSASSLLKSGALKQDLGLDGLSQKKLDDLVLAVKVCASSMPNEVASPIIAAVEAAALDCLVDKTSETRLRRI
jgi:hypothetical protein